MSDLLLLVEDDPGTAHLVQRYLRTIHPGPVALATDCDGAVNYLKTTPECVRVIADLGLPDADGLEVVEKLRQASPNISILAISNHANNAEFGGSYRSAAADLGVMLLPKSGDHAGEWARVVYAALLMSEALSAAASRRVLAEADAMFAELATTAKSTTEDLPITEDLEPKTSAPTKEPKPRWLDPSAVPPMVVWATLGLALSVVVLGLLALLAALGVDVSGVFGLIEAQI